jgi:hypothetical protein
MYDVYTYVVCVTYVFSTCMYVHLCVYACINVKMYVYVYVCQHIYVSDGDGYLCMCVSICLFLFMRCKPINMNLSVYFDELWIIRIILQPIDIILDIDLVM